MRFYTLLLFLASSTWADNGFEQSPNCLELKSQEALDLKQMMNIWYVMEILEHKQQPGKPMGGSRIVVDTCPVIQLTLTSNYFLKMLWTESLGHLEYTFRIHDTRTPGLWVSTALQNGTLVGDHYNQFMGSVHVMKAVASHMVLTFCMSKTETQLFSLLLSRKRALQKSDIKGVHNLLPRRRLNIVSTRVTCTNASGNSRGTFTLEWMTLVVLFTSGFFSTIIQ
ncbi:uncharacterized protein LOC107264380 [Cephus cinctus]|uniref:Uncharacterized protein LOC107264380 n=1 Tax=Cephus cinctus TaxID=211228 RepID=A0AAJ7BKB1_CEPCN|nr:uncharacterized protein LOC107264380 [Cephus cinctus]